MKKTFLTFVVAAFLCFSGQVLGGEPRFYGVSILTADLTFKDDVAAVFGTDSDFQLEYDSGNGYLQLGDGTNDFLRITDAGTTAGFYVLGNLGIGLTPVAGTRLTLPLENDAVTPTLAFGDGDTGFYENPDDELRVSYGGVLHSTFDGTGFYVSVANSPLLKRSVPSNTVPGHTFYDDQNTGLGTAGADQLSLIAGGVEGIRISEATTTETEITGRVVMSDSALSVTTEANITDPLASSVLLITGDDDTDNDAIDLQNGETAGQVIYIIAEAAVDVNDTITINMADTTCTNCPAIVFDKVGENATLIWTGTTWAVTGLQSSL